MYPNFNSEKARVGLTLKEMAPQLGITIGALSRKLTGKNALTLDEARKLKELVGTDLSLDELFQEG